MMSVPVAITPDIRSLCLRIGVTSDPVFVPVETRFDAEENDCFIDVQKQCKSKGGEAVIGWQIWEWPGVLVEAEFHAVWRSPSKALLDVSFKKDGETTVLFVEDPTLIYTGEKIDNIRLAVWDHPLVHEFIRVNEDFQREVVKIYGKGYLGPVRAVGQLPSLYGRLRTLPAEIIAALADFRVHSK